MIRNAINALLRSIGKSNAVGADIPVGMLLGEMAAKATALVRGLIFTRRRVFLHSGVRLRGKRRLRMGSYAVIERGVVLNAYAREGVSIGARTRIGAYSMLSATNHLGALGKGIRIGADSAIGQFSFVGAHGGVEIGDNVIMGQYVSFHAQNHNFSDPALPIRLQGTTSRGIRIDDDVWVGAKATFLDGCHVSSHSVVAAGAVVTGSFPPGVVIGGVPARVLRKAATLDGNPIGGVVEDGPETGT
jgi:acetyltransferase-like isoleucine patch superfamily enzyme